MNQNEIMDARWNYKGNVKIGSIASFAMLAGNTVHESKYGPVTGTCGRCCEYCWKQTDGKKRRPCYVDKSYRYPSVVDGHARNTLSVRNDCEKAFQQLSNSLTRKRKPVTACRYDEAGEIENKKVHECMAKVAAEHTETPFYNYSKQFDIVTENLLAGIVPENFTNLFSIWHEQGIEEYKKVAHMSNVKAYVFLDKPGTPGGWTIEDYKKHGIEITTLCHAYNEKGKLNHEVTCDKCRKCFNRLNSCKVIGCYDHS